MSKLWIKKSEVVNIVGVLMVLIASYIVIVVYLTSCQPVSTHPSHLRVRTFIVYADPTAKLGPNQRAEFIQEVNASYWEYTSSWALVAVSNFSNLIAYPIQGYLYCALEVPNGHILNVTETMARNPRVLGVLSPNISGVVGSFLKVDLGGIESLAGAFYPWVIIYGYCD